MLTGGGGEDPRAPPTPVSIGGEQTYFSKSADLYWLSEYKLTSVASCL